MTFPWVDPDPEESKAQGKSAVPRAGFRRLESARKGVRR